MKIAIVSGSRAEFGLLEPLAREVLSRSHHELDLYITGAHLDSTTGHGGAEVAQSKIPVAAQVKLDLDSDTSSGISKALAQSIAGFSEVLEKRQPDFLIALGDRYETFGAVQASLFAQIRVAHLHGGELTESLVDDAIRHSITKMSHLHFCSSTVYGQRIIQLGEDPKSVHCLGPVFLDRLRTTSLLSRLEVGERFGFPQDHPWILSTFHPVTLDSRSGSQELSALLEGIDQWIPTISESGPKPWFIWTLPGMDAGSQRIRDQIAQWLTKNPELGCFVTSLGHQGYLSALSESALVLGNSSSGMIEAPYFGVPTVNVGERQRGRLRCPSIIDTGVQASEIAQALGRGLQLGPKLKAQPISNRKLPFTVSNSSLSISAQIINYIEACENLPISKHFYDLKQGTSLA
jgi:GDP/UDP-N,N'-diacetylbacillosamine 2-epimerase (hydrolysing)